ncbi:MAG: hypothetical protein K2K45_03245 [Muribaculaceae bacterium]|nr:hypothetical protein [Muribaculaceae bacterium]
MEMNNWTIQDWSAAIGAVIAIGGVVFGIFNGIRKLFLWLKHKYNPQAANIRANFFKQGKGWRIRVYNASETDIHAEKVQVIIPETEGVYVHWDDSKTFPCLKRHGSFDINVLLCTSAPDFMSIFIKWVQNKKEFCVTETIQLRS